MQALVEHYSQKGWLQRVEQCVLHMDISSLDFNQVCNFQMLANFFFSSWPFLFNNCSPQLWIDIHFLLGCQVMPGTRIVWCPGVSL